MLDSSGFPGQMSFPTVRDSSLSPGLHMLTVSDVWYPVCIATHHCCQLLLKMVSFKGEKESCNAAAFLCVHTVDC